MDIKEKLLSRIKINLDNECWEWQKGKMRKYGAIRLNGKSQLAHRVSYNVFVGEIPNKMLICHHCDNPPCINPKHLFLGTYKDNYQDCKNKNRLNYKGNFTKKLSKSLCGKIIRIKRALSKNKTIIEIALLTKMTQQEISDIRDKKIYADIGTSITF